MRAPPTRGKLAAALWLLLLAPALLAQEELEDRMQLSCDQPQDFALQCQYRQSTTGTAGSISASANGSELPVKDVVSYPWPGAVTAVLLAIDTSDPGREPVIIRNADQVDALLQAAGPDFQFGLASFDSGLHMEAPLGTSRSGIAAAAHGLKAEGLTTELYRSLLQAIDVLSAAKADRRAILVLSDGQAEDEAYFSQDVVLAARRAGVVIDSLGFPRSVARSVALQTLRRLSQETGGAFVESSTAFELPPGFATTLFGPITSGGRFRVDLEGLRKSQTRVGIVHVTLDTAGGGLERVIPLARPIEPQQAGQPVRRNAAVPASPASSAPLPAASEGNYLNAWLWYGVPAALLVLIVLTIITLFLTYRKPRTAARSTPAPYAPKPFAYLITQDERPVRHAITGTVWRIGRSRDNELTLDDSSVSRRHAEIQRTGDGKFLLIDHNSTNGVFVNDEKIGRRELQEGDIIEIGDIFLRFSASPADYPHSENTGVQHTRAPRV